MILDKQQCPDCKGTGIAPGRGGLCVKCHGAGKRVLRSHEEPNYDGRCPCGRAAYTCDGSCRV